MSGDVQPRKRKDKKRRKDEGEQIPIQTQAPAPTNTSNDDVNIHVHKESGTGGGICAKLVFFVLFSALIVVIGMIITQYRGFTDVETVDTESRFSQIFEGWIDSSPDHHDDHDIEDALDDHDLDHDEEDDHNASEDEEDEEDEEEHEPSEEEDEDDDDENNEDTELSEERNEVDEDDDDQDEDEEQAVEDSEENQLDEDEEDEDVQASEERDNYESEEKDEDEDEDNEDEQDHDEDEQELENIDSEEDKDDDNEAADEVSTERKSGEDDEAQEDDDDDEEDEDDTKTEKAPVTAKKIKKDTGDEDAPGEEKQQESSGSAAERQADVENSDSEKSDDDAGYQFSNITNKDDYKIKSDIDEAQKSVQNNSAYAIKLFDKILQKHPSSPRSIYGKALALDYLADQRRSNDILEQALKFYVQLLNTQNVPNALFQMTAERCVNRMRFVGQYRSAINVHKLVIQRFPNNPKHSNDLAVTYLTINRVEEARSVLKKILDKWPNDGFALVHYGFILKTADNKLEEAIDYLKRGIETRAEGVVDGRFYFHLGDALARLGENEEAMKIYEEGVKNKVFLSKYQRSLYNVPRLTGKAWWDLSDLPYLDLFRLLKQNWNKIRDEGLAVLNEKGYFQDESENLKDTGDWKQFELFARGQKNLKNCKICPVTCSIIDRIPEARNCKRGQTKFSVMHPGTHVWPHCGPTNCRLRVHLGLKVPPKTFIRVADEIRSWEEGEVFVFDDSFEHEVWHNGTEFRLVLIIDVWHPELIAAEKRSLSPI